ncbi:hypothetical protein [Streptomyces sp. NPDC021356]|uniref:hypothetical protein n=1 Tax=Streptomyces sp. NPDC021356 TaxID=3154900 RepID=UPI0034057665
MLGIEVAPSTVWETLRAHGIEPAPERGRQTWAAFLRGQAHAILACDFFTAATLNGATAYVFAVIEHADRRRDSKYTRAFDAVFEAEGVEILTTGIRVPRMNSITERWVQTWRHELLDPYLDLEPGPPAPRAERVRGVLQRTSAAPHLAQCGTASAGPRTDH